MLSIGRVEKVERTLTLVSELATLGLDDIQSSIATLERELCVLRLFETLLRGNGTPTSPAPAASPSLPKESKVPSAPAPVTPAPPVRMPVTPPVTALLSTGNGASRVPTGQPPKPTDVRPLSPSSRREQEEHRVEHNPDSVRSGNVGRLLGLPSSAEAGVMHYDPAEDEAAELEPLEDDERDEDEDEDEDEEFPEADPSGDFEEDEPPLGPVVHRRGKNRDFTQVITEVCETIAGGITSPGKIEKHLKYSNLYIYRVLRDERMKRFVYRVDQGLYNLTEAGRQMVASRRGEKIADLEEEAVAE